MSTSPNPEAASSDPESNESFDNVVDLPTANDEGTDREIARRNLGATATSELRGVKPGSEKEKEIIARYQQQKRDLYSQSDNEQEAA